MSALSINDNPIGQWINVDGNPEVYFDGGHSDEHVCACGIQNNCTGSAEDFVCNCDFTVPEFQFDAGTIVDTEALPMKGFQSVFTMISILDPYYQLCFH